MTVEQAIAHAAVLVVFPVAATLLGAVAAVLRPPGPRLTSAVQHLAAGVVLAALAGELLPELKGEGNLVLAVTGFAAGTALVLALGALSRRLERTRPAQARASIPVGLVAAVAVDLLLDGLLVGLGSALGEKQGLILTIALTIEVLFVGLSVTVTLLGERLRPLIAVLVAAGLAVTIAIGALLGAALLSGASSAALAFVLAFGAAALLYLVVEELLTEAHEQAETTLLTAMFFLGFIVIYVLAA